MHTQPAPTAGSCPLVAEAFALQRAATAAAFDPDIQVNTDCGQKCNSGLAKEAAAACIITHKLSLLMARLTLAEVTPQLTRPTTLIMLVMQA